MNKTDRLLRNVGRPTNPIIRIIMQRDKLTIEEANDIYQDALEDARQATSLTQMEDIMSDHFGLEPDYVDVLLDDLTS